MDKAEKAEVVLVLVIDESVHGLLEGEGVELPCIVCIVRVKGLGRGGGESREEDEATRENNEGGGRGLFLLSYVSGEGGEGESCLGCK